MDKMKIFVGLLVVALVYFPNVHWVSRKGSAYQELTVKGASPGSSLLSFIQSLFKELP